MDDRDLIKEILGNNEQAFGVLIDKYKRLVYSTIFRLIRCKDDAEDLFQEVFVEVFRSLHHVRNEVDLSSWLFKIAYNKSISFLRKKNPARATGNCLVVNPFLLLEAHGKFLDQETPVRKLEQAEARQILFSAIDRLPEMQRKVLLMHKFEAYSQQEICKILKLSRPSVESLIFRAKVNLRKSLYSYFRRYIS